MTSPLSRNLGQRVLPSDCQGSYWPKSHAKACVKSLHPANDLTPAPHASLLHTNHETAAYFRRLNEPCATEPTGAGDVIGGRHSDIFRTLLISCKHRLDSHREKLGSGGKLVSDSEKHGSESTILTARSQGCFGWLHGALLRLHVAIKFDAIDQGIGNCRFQTCRQT